MEVKLLEKFGGTIQLKAHADADAAESARLYQQVLHYDVELPKLWQELQPIFLENRRILEEINKARRDAVGEVYTKENLSVLEELRGNTRAEQAARKELETALKELQRNLTTALEIEHEAVKIRMLAGDHKYRKIKIDRDMLAAKSWNIKVRANQLYISAGYPPIIKEVRPAFRSGPAPQPAPRPEPKRRKSKSQKKESVNVQEA